MPPLSYHSPRASYCSQGISKILSVISTGSCWLPLLPYPLISRPLPMALCIPPHGYSVPSASNTFPHPKPINSCLCFKSLFKVHFFREAFLDFSDQIRFPHLLISPWLVLLFCSSNHNYIYIVLVELVLGYLCLLGHGHIIFLLLFINLSSNVKPTLYSRVNFFLILIFCLQFFHL